MNKLQHDRRRSGEPSAAEHAVSIYYHRRRRDALFADFDLFGEPAYDILLDLYIAHHEGRQVTVSDACNAAYVPWTTAIRQINRLQALGLIRRSEDNRDRRRWYVALEPKALAKLDELLS